MMVWLLVTGDGALYPISHSGRIPGYTTKRAAQEKAKIVSEYDKDYLYSRDGLCVKPLVAEQSILKSLKIKPVYE